jgi:hypothetical protein
MFEETSEVDVEEPGSRSTYVREATPQQPIGVIKMPRFMGFVRMEEGVGTPPQALFDAMDAHIGERAAKGVSEREGKAMEVWKERSGWGRESGGPGGEVREEGEDVDGGERRSLCTAPGASPRPTRPALPPAAERLVPNHPRRNLDVSEVAELPEFLRRSRVLEEQLVDFERVEFSSPEAFDRPFHVTDKLA